MDLGVTSDIPWVIGVSSLPPTVFTKVLSILHHTHMGAFAWKGEAAARFYALVRIGTPVNIANAQPEDETIGPKGSASMILGRLTPASLMIWTRRLKPSGPLLQ